MQESRAPQPRALASNAVTCGAREGPLSIPPAAGEGDKGRLVDEGNNFKRILAQLLSFLRKPLTYHVGRSLFIQNDRRTSPLPLCEMNLYLISTLYQQVLASFR